MNDEPTDSRRISSLAVHRDDVLAAFEARERGREPTVLRVVAPFSGRMRARLHVAHEDAGEDEIHIPPSTFVADPPSFPHVDGTADRLREAGEYDLDRHREAHQRAVERWRERVDERLRDRITLPPASDHEVTVAYLG